jgi:hypothetical protein
MLSYLKPRRSIMKEDSDVVTFLGRSRRLQRAELVAPTPNKFDGPAPNVRRTVATKPTPRKVPRYVRGRVARPIPRQHHVGDI